MSSILLIGDDEPFRSTLAGALTECGYTVTQAADRAIGVKLFRDHPADLVATDIAMPNQDGIETIQILRRAHPLLGIIAISGGAVRGASLYLVAAKAFGVNRTVLKPFGLPTLLAAIGEVLAETRKSMPII